jgi:septal ring factor EnvC (AmiA/AmiB activator)
MSLREQIQSHAAALAAVKAEIAAWRSQYDALDKQINKMTKRELILVVHKKDEELAVLRNRLARYGDQQATPAQLSAARALMDEVIHEHKA